MTKRTSAQQPAETAVALVRPPEPSRSRGRMSLAHIALVGALALAGCGSEPTAPTGGGSPPAVASLRVVSPIDSVMAVGRTTTLQALALDAGGTPVAGAAVTWSSSDEAVATVSGGGVLEGVAAGIAVLSAVSDGTAGTLGVRVVDADLEAVAALLGDAYLARLVDALTGDARGAVSDALGDCSDALPPGHVLALRDCLRAVGSEGAADPTDQVLVAVLGVLALRAEQLLAL